MRDGREVERAVLRRIQQKVFSELFMLRSRRREPEWPGIAPHIGQVGRLRVGVDQIDRAAFAQALEDRAKFLAVRQQRGWQRGGATNPIVRNSRSILRERLQVCGRCRIDQQCRSLVPQQLGEQARIKVRAAVDHEYLRLTGRTERTNVVSGDHAVGRVQHSHRQTGTRP
ncbi:MAG: hypothetical protein AVDCRST_MAG42-2420 [uncultured Chthoniobacterales bacterium]|uniref:Uncharacterized protein n=1 Tax=uncultured Chthoniobacterales bacterium TaxID=1836801 RepID=A0A6J4ICD9_9BACT|nr:MAG: hypothetical protein AVDCRST_MAG42-2420 [uncultured Chthoniobacterales bacterium]